MRILITGAAGFLGAALSNRLVRDGHTVRGLDDLSTGNPEALAPEVFLNRGDVNDRPKLWTLLQDIDCVYHLAARVSVQESMLYPREYNHVNVGGTVSLLEAMRDVGVKRVIFVSSGAVYGNQGAQPLAESASPNPGSPYAVSKLSSEFYIRTIGALWEIDSVVLRVFNAYGPGQHLPPAHAPVIPSFLRQASSNGNLVVHSDGAQTRDYVYIDDVVEALVAAGGSSAANGKIINIGSGEETTIRDLVRMAIETAGGSPQVIYNPRHEGGVRRMCADLSVARAILDYQPKISLADGLRKTLEQDPRLRLR